MRKTLKKVDGVITLICDLHDSHSFNYSRKKAVPGKAASLCMGEENLTLHGPFSFLFLIRIIHSCMYACMHGDNTKLPPPSCSTFNFVFCKGQKVPFPQNPLPFSDTFLSHSLLFTTQITALHPHHFHIMCVCVRNNMVKLINGNVYLYIYILVD